MFRLLKFEITSWKFIYHEKQIYDKNRMNGHAASD